MSLIPWRAKGRESGPEDLFFAPLGALRSEMDRLFDRFLGSGWGDFEGFSGLSAWAPSVDISETDTEITVRAEVAGVDPKELEITVYGSALTLSGQKKETKEIKDRNFYRSERRFGAFRRVIQLPVEVDSEKVSAEHKNGVVTITVKKQPGAVAKKIPVKSA